MKQIEKTLFFLTLLLIPTQLGKHFWPEFSFLYSLKIDYYSPTIYLWDLFFMSLIFFWLKRKPYINQKALSVLLFFLLSQELSLLKEVNLGLGLVRLEQITLIGFFGLYITSLNFEDFKEILRKALVVILIFESFLSFGQFLNSGSLGFWILGERSFSLSTPDIAKFNWFGQVFLRPYGTFSHPNVMAGFMVVLMPIIVYLNEYHKKRYEVIIGSFATILSFSRTATVLLMIEGVFFLRKKIKILITILLILAPIIFIRFNSALNFDNLSLIRREELIQTAIFFFKQSPIFGIGLNNFINLSSVSLISGPSRFLQPVHNIILLILTETGFVGLVGFLILIIYPIIKLWLGKKKLGRILIYSWISIFFLGMFDHYFITIAQGQRLFFLIWGLSLAL